MTQAISGACLRRLPRYMTVLARLVEEGQGYVTSAELARQLKLDETLVRKDLSVTGFTGKPRMGFDVAALLHHLEAYLGLQQVKEAFIIGAGRLGQALAGYPGFEKYHLRIVAMFDNSPEKIGRITNGLEIQPLWTAPALARKMHVQIAILTVPPHAAQGVADLLVDAGMRAFWNFSGYPLSMPSSIVVHNEDLAESLAVICHQLAQMA